MKIKLILISVIVSFSGWVNAAFQLPNYETITLDNGLTLILMPQREVPLVDFRLVTRAGSVLDDNKLGLANLTAQALSFGSGKMSKKAIEDLMDFHGARLSMNAGKESTTVSLSLAVQDMDKLLPVFRDVVVSPNFNKNEFSKFKTRLMSQLKQQRESPRSIISRSFDDLFYADHPYGTSTVGNEKSVERLSLKDVYSFYNDNFSASNSALVVVGDFDSGKMKTRVTKLFKDWKKGKSVNPNLPIVVPSKQAEVLLIDKQDAIETTFMVGGIGVSINHPDSVAIDVINTLLGGRFTSWLNDELRVNSGLTYGARSRFTQRSKGGTFVISTFTKKETTFEALDLALTTYARLWNKGIDKKLLDSAKAYVKGQFPPDYETSNQLSGLLATMWSLGLDDGFINDFEKNVDALTVKKAKQIIAKVFPKNNLKFVLIGKADDLREKAKKYGKVTEVNIKDYQY